MAAPTMDYLITEKVDFLEGHNGQLKEHKLQAWLTRDPQTIDFKKSIHTYRPVTIRARRFAGE